MTTTSNNGDGTFRVSDNWAMHVKNLKERFSLLSDADLACEPGKEEEMLKRIQNRLSKDRTAVLSIIRAATQSRPLEGSPEDSDKK